MAFAYYLQLGADRSYPFVSRQFSVSVTSVKKWAKSFGWEQRVREADEKANAGQRKGAEESYVRTKEEFCGLKDDVFRRLKARAGAKDCSVMELIHILRAVKLELGEPTHITALPQPKEEYPNPFKEICEALISGKSGEGDDEDDEWSETANAANPLTSVSNKL